MFKIGDKVKVLDGSKIHPYVCGWTSGMREYVDSVHAINEIKISFTGEVMYGLSGAGTWLFAENGLELVEEKCLEKLVSEPKPLPERYVIHTKTRKEARYLFECGIFSLSSVASWKSDGWDEYKEKSAYRVDSNNLVGFAGVDYYSRLNSVYGEVIEFDEWCTRIGKTNAKTDDAVVCKVINDRLKKFTEDKNMVVDIIDEFEINKTNNTKVKYIRTKVKTALGKASVRCRESEYEKMTGVYIACAKITASKSEEANLMYEIAMKMWDSDMGMKILDTLADRACDGDFGKMYKKFIKEENHLNKKLCTCHVCGTTFETSEQAREHEKWHNENKKRKHEAYLIRKEAKKRIADAERESKIESLMADMLGSDKT